MALKHTTGALGRASGHQHQQSRRNPLRTRVPGRPAAAKSMRAVQPLSAQQPHRPAGQPAAAPLLPCSPCRAPRRAAVAASASSSATPIPPPTAAPGKTTLAFVGIGIMGLAMCQNLLRAGYDVVVWNRTPERCEPLKAAGARVAATARDAAAAADLTFGMLADPQAALEVATGPGGVAAGMSPGKGYVDVSTVDVATSRQVAQAVRARGGMFLEAPVSGSKGPAEQGALIFLAAGDAALYEAAAPALDVMGKARFYLGGAKDGEPGNGAIMKLVINQIMGGVLVAFAEGLSLAKEAGLSEKEVLEVAALGAIANPMMALKGPAMVERRYPTAFPLKHSQKDLRLSLELARELGLGEESRRVAEAAYAAHVRASAEFGRAEEDFSAVMEAVLKR
jgi:glyoxylate/succinic semialdehyde reductase